MNNNIDLLVTKTKNGVFDLSIQDGDFVGDFSFKTAINVSLFCDRRADSSEITETEYRRGWWGSVINGFEIGSKLWLLSQERLTQSTANRARDYISESLQWMITDGHLSSIEVSTQIVSKNIEVTIKFKPPNVAIETTSFILWENTK